MKSVSRRNGIIKTGVCLTVLYGLFALILAVMAVHRIYPDGQTENPLFVRLLAGISINTIVTDDKWRRTYPFDESAVALYARRIRQAESSIENYCTESFPQIVRIHRIADTIRERVYRFQPDTEDRGYETDTRERVLWATGQVAAFHREMEEQGIPFLYVQTPDAGTGPVEDGGISRRAEMVKYLLQGLEEQGVCVINTERKCTELQFDLSDHWFPENALECTGMIAGFLRELPGFTIEDNLFDRSAYQNMLSEYPAFADAVRTTCGYDYSMPVPFTDHHFRLVYDGDEEWYGSFREVFFLDQEQWKAEDAAYQSMLRIKNAAHYEIWNENASAGKHVLIIGDSFSWPVETYLSLAVKKITVIYNPVFHGSIIRYVGTEKPDAVIVCYNDSSLNKNALESKYDLR